MDLRKYREACAESDRQMAVERDAARYRFLRTSTLLPDVLAHELDAAVDAAMARAADPRGEMND
jgi:hypothetical protein